MPRPPAPLCLCLCLLLGLAAAQEQSLDAIQDKLNETVTQFANNGDLNNTLAKGEEVLKQKCIKNAADGNGEEAYQKTVNAKNELIECGKREVNTAELQAEMEAAKPKGELDEVFKKYCGKRNNLQTCFETYTDTLKTCLDQEEKKNLKIVHNITLQLVDFICFKDGDRIALFIAEKGPECLAEQTEKIQTCVQSVTKSDTFQSNNVSIDTLASIDLKFGASECSKMVTLQSCVVEALGNCKQPTPQNIAEALFKYIRKATPCGDKPEAAEITKGSPNSGAVLYAAVGTLASALAAVALL